MYEEDKNSKQQAKHSTWIERCYYFCGLTERQENILELQKKEQPFPLIYCIFQVSIDPHISRRYGLLVLFSTCHALVTLNFWQLRSIRVESERL